MRRYVAAFAVAVMPFAVGSCEDGPNQTYSPAPPNAGNIWNGSPGAGGLGDGGAFVAPATQNYDGGIDNTGQNSNQLCTATQEKTIWTALFTEPIQLPGLGAGLDMAGGPKGDGASGYVDSQTPFTYDPTKETWSGCTVEQAEKILCQATNTPDQVYFGVTATAGWGESLEVNVQFNPNSRIITDLIFFNGYNGSMSGTDASGTTYTIAMNNLPITATPKGGQPQQVLFDWTNSTTFYAQINKIYEALRYTYAPTFPPDADCVSAGHCIVGNFLGQGGYIWMTPINVVVYVGTTIGTPIADSTPVLMDVSLQKLLPFSTATALLKIDAEGPTATQPDVEGLAKTDPNYPNTTTCKFKLGDTFQNFNSQCVEPYTTALNGSKAPAENAVAESKLFGALAHGNETYRFDIQGVDPQFYAASQAPTDIVADGQNPAAGDTIYEFNVDQFSLGAIANDYQNNDPTTGVKDLHGIGMITLEWATLVQHYMQKAYGVTTELGDPNCLSPYSAAQPHGAGVVCSGIEGIVTTAPTALAPCAGQPLSSGVCTVPANYSVNALGLAATQVTAAANIAIGLKPGTWYSVFCNDAGGTLLGAPNGYNTCVGGTAGFNGNAAYYWDSMQDAILQGFGQKTYGGGTTLPPLSAMPSRDLGARRFFFQQWILATIKYLQSSSNPTATLAQIDANPVDENELFFDNAGADFDSGEYVFRNNVNSQMQAPLDLQIYTEIGTGIMNNWTFGRQNFRGENAMYTALTTVPGDLPGAEDLYLSNVVGAPILTSTYGSYACAINTSKTNTSCGFTGSNEALLGPVDALGNPLLTGYQPAFGQSAFNIAALGAQPTPAPFTIDTQGPPGANFPLKQVAMITVPIWSNPFDPTTATPTDKTVKALQPFLPIGAGAGFPVTIDGSRDKFYNTNELVLSGETFDGTMDFESVAFQGADGGAVNQWVVRGLESSNYLGLAFACVQPSNTDPYQKDLLYVRMYSSGADLLSYISSHPGATTACQLQIKYSIYGNYADFISSLQYGVRFGLNATFGGAVVSDLTFFDPNIVASLGQ